MFLITFGSILEHFGISFWQFWTIWDHLGVTGHPGGPLSEIMSDFQTNMGSQNEPFLAQFSVFCDLLTFLQACFFAGFWNLPWEVQCDREIAYRNEVPHVSKKWDFGWFLDHFLVPFWDILATLAPKRTPGKMCQKKMQNQSRKSMRAMQPGPLLAP